MFNIDIEKMYLYLLDIGEYIEINLKDEDIEKGIQDIVEVFNFMEVNTDFDKFDRCENCYSCNYRLVCE